MISVVFGKGREGDEDVGRIGGKKAPSPPSIALEMMNFACSRALSIMRLPPPVGIACWLREVMLLRDLGGNRQPRAIPFLDENEAVGVSDLWDGFPGRRVWVGESWKRYGNDEGSEALMGVRVDGFQGSGRYAPMVINSPSPDDEDPDVDVDVETP